ncbi:sensor histidine kinase KdpD [Pelagibius sp. Alg239-R121]|uniref:sensor histidine kinase n=1 Tax=Pelagibius sp. Alg239-R121 TaxID=2993448 RepID=UPI0024A6788A|nr:HAMP domain-containing sensor histidine kinase [Pelagibius sp. Alg239-R121]
MIATELHSRFLRGSFQQVSMEIAGAHSMATAYNETMNDLLNTRRILDQANNELEKQLAAKEVLIRKLRETKKQANAANRAKAAFLSHMSHELRTPLTGVMGLAEMMQMKIYGPFGDERYDSYLDGIIKSSRHLLKHLESMLEASRVELQEANFDIGNLCLRNSVAQVLTLFTHNAKRRNIRLKTAIPRNCPEVRADEAWLRWILCSLLENAIKFSSNGKSVAIAAWKEDRERVSISITDQGPGMSREEVEAALILFGATDSMHAKHNRGLGVGLSISKRLAEVQGGTLSIDTEPGQGTIVTVRLPYVVCEDLNGFA